jgi:dynein heavy chain
MPQTPQTRKRKAGNKISEIFMDSVSEGRYWSYISNIISSKDLDKMTEEVWKNIFSRMSKMENVSEQMLIIKSSLVEEVNELYAFSMKKAMMDYILLDENEQKRLKVFQHLSPENVGIRGPFPWHIMLESHRKYIRENLFMTHSTIHQIKKLFDPYFDCRIVDVKTFRTLQTPVTLTEFENIIKGQCCSFREKLITE